MKHLNNISEIKTTQEGRNVSPLSETKILPGLKNELPNFGFDCANMKFFWKRV